MVSIRHLHSRVRNMAVELNDNPSRYVTSRYVFVTVRSNKDQRVYIMDIADNWVVTVRALKDAEKKNGTEPYNVECLCRDILRYMRRVRIRDLGRFKQRTGLEYEAFIKSLIAYDHELVQRIVGDDDFWAETTGLSKR